MNSCCIVVTCCLLFRLVGLAFSGAFMIFIVVEYIRYPRIPPFGQILHDFMKTYLDSRDAGAFILTHIYLLLGSAFPLWLHLRWYEVHALHFMPALAGVIILGIGDSAVRNLDVYSLSCIAQLAFCRLQLLASISVVTNGLAPRRHLKVATTLALPFAN